MCPFEGHPFSKRPVVHTSACVNASRRSLVRLKMNGIARYLLTGGLVLATMQIITGPVADWNARREGAEVRVTCCCERTAAMASLIN
jgi:hypothetical protein